MYGFIRASEQGWRDDLTLGSFGAAVILLLLFALVESRAREPITPLRMFADRNRSGTYVNRLSLVAAMFGMFFFIVLFVQNVLNYWPIRAGLAFLPVTVVIALGAGLSQRLLPVLGPRPFMVTGTLIAVLGFSWQTLINPDSSYLGGALGPMMMFGFGMGLNFVNLALALLTAPALIRVRKGNLEALAGAAGPAGS